MLAAYQVGIGRVEVADAPDPVPGPGEVLLQTLAVGICGSDLKHLMRSGPHGGRGGPGDSGHESVGRVLESRSGHVAPGDFVLAVPVSTHSAAFAELQTVDWRQLIRLPQGLDVVEAVLAQQLGTVIYAIERFWPGPPGRVAVVLGTGGAGLQFVRMLSEAGFAEVVASDRSQARREAAIALGASHAVPAGSPELAGLVDVLTGGAGADLVVEAAGRDSARVVATGLIRERGTIGCYGLSEGTGEMLMPFGRLFQRQASLLCCVDAQREPGLVSFRSAIEAVAAGKAGASQLISHRMPFAEIGEALRLADGPGNGVLKVVLDMGTPFTTT
jgi:L-iditol 2-dehydrogenase